MGKTIRFSLDMSPEFSQKLEELAAETHGSKSEVLRKAVTLLEVAVQAKKEGKKFGVADKNQTLSTEIVGI